MHKTDCGFALDLLCPLDCDFPLGIHLPYHMYDRLSLDLTYDMEDEYPQGNQSNGHNKSKATQQAVISFEIPYTLINKSLNECGYFPSNGFRLQINAEWMHYPYSFNDLFIRV